MAGCPVHHHGVTKARGCDHFALTNFTKMFPDLDGLPVSEALAKFLGGPGGLMHDFDGTSPDCPIPAGYIFFAQFIDHDVTLDTLSELRGAPKKIDKIEDLANFRSPSLDLDCVYGFGPDVSPHLYDAPGRLAINPNGYDLARSPGGVALIGDPRNDENIFVSQMQLLFLRFHNKLYNERVAYAAPGSQTDRFLVAQQEARFHYQWLVLFDFLKRLCDRDVYKFAVNLLLAHDESFPFFYKPDAHGKLTMPVEFSVAAYRVGHTMVRSTYAVNELHQDIELFEEAFGTLGFGALPEDLVVDWRYLLPVDPCIRPRFSKAIDPLLADEIQRMPDPVVASNNPDNKALAFRNLLRGNVMSLPSGRAVAGALKGAGYPVDDALDLKLDELPLDGAPSPLSDDTLPLFYYLLRESKVVSQGQRFGPVGSAILLEVFGGMLRYCTETFIKRDWKPDPCVWREPKAKWHVPQDLNLDDQALVDDDDYYPFELADLARFVEAGE